MRELSFIVAPIQAGRKLGTILARDWEISKTLLARLKHRPGSVTVDGSPARMTDRITEGARVIVTIEEAGPESTAAGPAVLPDLSGQILYEDRDLLILNKPAGIKTHPAYGGDYTDTVAGWAREYLSGSFHPVTRLDKGTSGAMLIAKNGYMHSLLQRRLHTETCQRFYLAVASGSLDSAGEWAVIDLPLRRETESARRVLAAETDTERITAITYYKTLSSFTLDGADFTLLELRLGTGRTHQIRAHLAGIGHPLLGDAFYGGPESPRIDRPALHSYQITLVHPLTRELLVITAPLPADVAGIMGSV